VLLPPSQWLLDSPAEAPPPQPSTWGDHPPLPDTITQAIDELAHGQLQTALAVLASDTNDKLASALASLGRAMTSPVVLEPPAKPAANDEQLTDIAWKEAMRTMPQERARAFLLAMSEDDPPR
jgi:hypothetical protein